jgi:hypothetical protein
MSPKGIVQWVCSSERLALPVGADTVESGRIKHSSDDSPLALMSPRASMSKPVQAFRTAQAQIVALEVIITASERSNDEISLYS